MGTLNIVSYSGEPFTTRQEAGQLLADRLKKFKGKNTIVLGIPRGGLVIADQIARALEADFDMVLSHKLGAPWNPELAIGAICEGGQLFINKEIASYCGADENYINQEKSRQLQEISRKVRHYRQILPKLPLENKTVIITDDGVATGASLQASIWAVRQENPKQIIPAIPVAPEDSINKLAKDADETICLKVPPYFEALSQFYMVFNQVEDDHVLEILEAQCLRRKTQ
jgi:putative phosphoribosyl transferase